MKPVEDVVEILTEELLIILSDDTINRDEVVRHYLSMAMDIGLNRTLSLSGKAHLNDRYIILGDVHGKELGRFPSIIATARALSIGKTTLTDRLNSEWNRYGEYTIKEFNNA
jgi:pantothenate kinase